MLASDRKKVQTGPEPFEYRQDNMCNRYDVLQYKSLQSLNKAIVLHLLRKHLLNEMHLENAAQLIMTTGTAAAFNMDEDECVLCVCVCARGAQTSVF